MVSFKNAAMTILKSVDEPLTTKEITDIALQEGLIETGGQTPEATMGVNKIIKENNGFIIKNQ